MSAAPLEFRNVSKVYRLASRDLTPSGFWGRLRHTVAPYRRDFYALRDVSFRVARNETLGLIGHNGAGKSTVLKLLSKITAPTTGSIFRRGRIAGLIEVGSGFHPELSGRDNIFLSGAILGMRRAEIRSKLDSIVAFAGVDAFIDTPVKQYSSGMSVRLGFAVASHLDSDILLLDEVLAVGDSAFQAKCVDRILEMKREGRTMLFISHDLSAVEKLCDRLILLNRGQISAEGGVAEVLSRYQQQRKELSTAAGADSSNASVEIGSLTLRGPGDAEAESFDPGEPFAAEVAVTVRRPFEDLRVEVFCFRPDSSLPCQLYSRAAAALPVAASPGLYRFRFRCPALILAPGIYHLSVAVGDGATGNQLQLCDNAATIRVRTLPGLEGMRGAAFQPQTLQVERISEV